MFFGIFGFVGFPSKETISEYSDTYRCVQRPPTYFTCAVSIAGSLLLFKMHLSPAASHAESFPMPCHMNLSKARAADEKWRDIVG
jgi:hypothetical protein